MGRRTRVIVHAAEKLSIILHVAGKNKKQPSAILHTAENGEWEGEGMGGRDVRHSRAPGRKRPTFKPSALRRSAEWHVAHRERGGIFYRAKFCTKEE